MSPLRGLVIFSHAEVRIISSLRDYNDFDLGKTKNPIGVTLFKEEKCTIKNPVG
jgi:hypothetical protein